MDQREILKAAAHYVDDLASRRPEVLYAYAFGPFLRGQSGITGIIMMLSESRLAGDERIAEYAPKSFPTDYRVYPYVEDEWLGLMREQNSFLQNALKEAKLIFDRDDPTIVRFYKDPAAFQAPDH